MPLVLLKGHARFWYCFEKKSVWWRCLWEGILFFVCCLWQKRSWGCSFQKECCKFYHHLDCGVSVLILREKPFSVRKWLYLLTHSKRSSCASSLLDEIGTSSPASEAIILIIRWFCLPGRLITSYFHSLMIYQTAPPLKAHLLCYTHSPHATSNT